MNKKRHFLLGIDGMPYDFFMRLTDKGILPNLKGILKTANPKPIVSVYPTVSSVAWTSYATGKNPGEHGVFGFVEADWEKGLYIPTTADRTASTIWNHLSQKGKKVITINVPFTYPPEPVNGIQVACFLCPNIKKAAYPKEFADRLEKMDYIIDVNAPGGESDKPQFLRDLFTAMKKRVELSLELIKEDWDYFHLHIMETDRLFHFFWNSIGSGGEDEYTGEILEFFCELDTCIAALYENLPENTGFTVLSDHGFCGIKREVQLNAWLVQEGYLKFSGNGKKSFAALSPVSQAYSLTPGRIYLNRNLAQNQRMQIIEELKAKLLELKETDGARVIEKVFEKQEVYTGKSTGRAADLILHPRNGYDLKSDFSCDEIFTESLLKGMHTYENALLFSTSLDVSKVKDISQIAEYIEKELCC